MRFGGCTICSGWRIRVLYSMASGVRRRKDKKCMSITCTSNHSLPAAHMLVQAFCCNVCKCSSSRSFHITPCFSVALFWKFPNTSERVKSTHTQTNKQHHLNFIFASTHQHILRTPYHRQSFVCQLVPDSTRTQDDRTRTRSRWITNVHTTPFLGSFTKNTCSGQCQSNDCEMHARSSTWSGRDTCLRREAQQVSEAYAVRSRPSS